MIMMRGKNDIDVEPKGRNGIDGEGNQWGQQWGKNRKEVEQLRAMRCQQGERRDAIKKKEEKVQGPENLQLNSMGEWKK